MEELITKSCFKCGTQQPITNFYRHPEMSDGHVNKCKECSKKDVRENYRKNKKHYQQYELVRNQKEKRKEQHKLYNRRRKERDPEKAITRYLTSNAIRDGRLIRLPCEVCGADKVQAHHEDYTKPFEVRWLCFKHHREHHGQTVD